MRLSVFYGSFMRGHPGHANLEGARFEGAIETAARYRLFSMGDYPAMLPVEENGVAVAGELYDVPGDVWARRFCRPRHPSSSRARSSSQTAVSSSACSPPMRRPSKGRKTSRITVAGQAT